MIKNFKIFEGAIRDIMNDTYRANIPNDMFRLSNNIVLFIKELNPNYEVWSDDDQSEGQNTIFIHLGISKFIRMYYNSSDNFLYFSWFYVYSKKENDIKDFLHNLMGYYYAVEDIPFLISNINKENMDIFLSSNKYNL